MKIGIFDSGVGGLTVLKELINDYPFAHYIYYGDTKNLPYGEKSKEELLSLSCNIIDFLISKNVDIIVIACGTVSSNVYEELKSKYDIPIIDIITPVIDYIKENNLKNVGVLGTSMTIKSKVFEKENIKAVACPEFVSLIENGKQIDIYAKKYLSELECENIILGCTHYPIVLETLKKYKNANYINMGKCLLNKIKLKNKTELSVELYFSKVNIKIIKNVKRIIGDKYARITRS